MRLPAISLPGRRARLKRRECGGYADRCQRHDDPETGKQLWVTQLPFSTTARGVAFWPGDKDNPPRILLTATTHLVALNANTGRIDPGFGKEGIVDIDVPWNGVPAIFKNVVMQGATVGEVPLGPPGDSRA